MIKVARLKPRNKKAGHGMRTYTSAAGNKYVVGVGVQPSPIKIINDEKELTELGQFSQFEIRSFPNRAALDQFIDNEVAVKVRMGYQVAKPIVEELKAPNRTAKSILDQEDDRKENTGRVPQPVAAPNVADEARKELAEAVKEMEHKHAEAIELGRTDATIEKWENRLNDARFELNEYDNQKAAK